MICCSFRWLTPLPPLFLPFFSLCQARTSDFPSNRQRTTKYTWLTFVPLMLAMQLRRLAIAYFTLVVVIQLVRGRRFCAVLCIFFGGEEGVTWSDCKNGGV